MTLLLRLLLLRPYLLPLHTLGPSLTPPLSSRHDEERYRQSRETQSRDDGDGPSRTEVVIHDLDDGGTDRSEEAADEVQLGLRQLEQLMREGALLSDSAHSRVEGRGDTPVLMVPVPRPTR